MFLVGIVLDLYINVMGSKKGRDFNWGGVRGFFIRGGLMFVRRRGMCFFFFCIYECGFLIVFVKDGIAKE